MTEELAKRKQADIEAMHDTLEPHAADKHVALARQSLVAASFWMKKAAEAHLR